MTAGLEARPEGNLRIPRPTYLPFLLALGLAVFFLGLLIDAGVVGVLGLGLAAVALFWWTWRTDMDLR